MSASLQWRRAHEPTMLARIKRHWPYALVFLLVTGLFFLLIVYIPNYRFFAHVIASPLYTVAEKVRIMWYSLGSFQLNFSPFRQVIAIGIAILSGLNITLVVYYTRQFALMKQSLGAGLLGTLVGLIGIGCASCGSVLLSAVLGLTATAALVNNLPLGGVEFGLLSIAILLIANYIVIRRIIRPAACAVPAMMKK